MPSVGAATPHPLKILLHDLCRAVVRETLTPADLSDLLAKEDQARPPPEKIRRRTDTLSPAPAVAARAARGATA